METIYLLVSGRTVQLEVIVANDERTRYVGLANLPAMPPAANGMLFVFPADVTTPFTTAEMRFAIDILFFDSSGKYVDGVLGAEPSVVEVTPIKAYRYVLELPAGTAERLGARDGTTLILSS